MPFYNVVIVAEINNSAASKIEDVLDAAIAGPHLSIDVDETTDFPNSLFPTPTVITKTEDAGQLQGDPIPTQHQSWLVTINATVDVSSAVEADSAALDSFFWKTATLHRRWVVD